MDDMVLFFTTTLLVSCAGLVLLLSIKRWELNSGRIVGSRIRPWTQRLSHGISLWFERILPKLVQMYTKLAWQSILTSIHKVTARIVVGVEVKLEKTLHTLRHTTETRRGVQEEPSVFLREVSEHKRKLLQAQRGRPQLRKK